ncbi:MAG: ubiquinone biosynthesis regulatory protein kinase UbiB [Methylotetracoccus sp.]
MIPSSIRSLHRLLHIQWVLLYHGIDDLLLGTSPFRPLRFLAAVTPGYWLRDVHGPRAPRIRRALEQLGPIFVKFGQALSTRRDLLPEDIAEELVKLQDRVPPFPGADARRTIERALGESVATLFAEFDENPLASASVAQVHAARLKDGSEVVVKVLRPGIDKRIKSDIALLYRLASMVGRLWPDARRLRPVEVVAEFEKTILDELDLIREAANATEIRRRFDGSEMLYVPRVYWDFTRRDVLVMERISGIPVGEVDALREAGVDFPLLATRGVEIFFTQVFRDNFFHADMHPGNIFVVPEARYIAVDFGIVGSLSRSDQYYIAENLLAFFNRDYRRVAEMHVESGWVPATTRIEEFESAIRTVSEPIFEKPLSEISFGQVLLRLFQVARRFDMEVQPQLVLLQKTLLNIEGLGRQLYPQLDLWATAKPFLERWVKQQIGPQATLQKIRTQLPEWAQQWPEVPGLAHRALRDAAEGRLALRLQSPELDELRRELGRNHQRLLRVLAGGTLIISTALAASPGGLLAAGGWPLWATLSTGALLMLSAMR